MIMPGQDIPDDWAEETEYEFKTKKLSKKKLKKRLRKALKENKKLLKKIEKMKKGQ